MLTQERLRELIDYDPITGIALWRIRRGGLPAGSRVGTIAKAKRSSPYRMVSLKEETSGKKVFSHIVFFYMTGQWPTEEIDHENGDTLDDRWENLRESTRSQNEANRGARRNSKSGIKGVFLLQGRYRAEIYRNGVRKYLGTFDNPEQARAAYQAEAEKLDGEFLRAA
jgi:hypothetical protein